MNTSEGKTMRINKKELINEYKNRKIVGGVYKITNSKSGSYWIDITTEIDKITNRFNFLKSTNTYFSLVMQDEWDKYGAESFNIEIVDRLDRKPEQNDEDFKKELELLKELWKSGK